MTSFLSVLIGMTAMKNLPDALISITRFEAERKTKRITRLTCCEANLQVGVSLYLTDVVS